MEKFRVNSKSKKTGVVCNTHSFFRRASEDHDIEVRNPVLELTSPILEGTLWDDDEMRTGEVAVVLQKAEERNRLQRLAETLEGAKVSGLDGPVHRPDLPSRRREYR